MKQLFEKLKQAAKDNSCASCPYGHCCKEAVFCDEVEVKHAIAGLSPSQIEIVKYRTGTWMAVAVTSGILNRAINDDNPYPKPEEFEGSYADMFRRLNLWCPLFDRDSGKCMVYERRPLACALYFAHESWTFCEHDSLRHKQQIGKWDIDIVGAMMASMYEERGRPAQVSCDHLAVGLHNILFGTKIKTASHEEGYIYYTDDGIELRKQPREES